MRRSVCGASHNRQGFRHRGDGDGASPPNQTGEKIGLRKVRPDGIFARESSRFHCRTKRKFRLSKCACNAGAKTKDFPFNIDFFGKPKVRVAVAFERGSDGIARAVSYSEKPAGGAYLDLTLESCNFVRYENSKKIPLEQPELEFKQPFSLHGIFKKAGGADCKIHRGEIRRIDGQKIPQRLRGIARKKRNARLR